MIANHLAFPLGGSVEYVPAICEAELATQWFEALRSELPWQKEALRMFGKDLVLRREVVWCADQNLSYTYSGKTKESIPWSRTLLEIRAVVESRSGESFNACLLNYYPCGSEGMSWHSDDESSIVPQSTIASVSLGVARKFVFKPKTGGTERYEYRLENGSLLLMKGALQRHYLHALPKSKRILEPRINLTFRQMRQGV